MNDQDVFERIVASLHDAVLDETRWSATSALIDAACGTQGNALFVGAGPKDDGRVLFGQLYYRGASRDDLLHEYLTVYHPLDASVPRLRCLPANHLVHITALYTTEELQTSPAYNEMLPRLNAQDSVNVRLTGLDGSHIAWDIADPVSPGGWSTPQLALLRGLLPHIRHFVRVRQTLVRAETLGAAVTALLDTRRVGVLYLDRYGQIVEANDRARAILRAGDGLTDQGGELTARKPADHTRLARLIAAALPTSSPPAVSGSMPLQRGALRRPFVVHVTPVDARPLDFGARPVAAVVLIAEPGHVTRIDPAPVAAALGLTAVEGQVAAWLAEGRTVPEIAAAMGRTSGAVYWSLNQIYRKQGIAR